MTKAIHVPAPRPLPRPHGVGRARLDRFGHAFRLGRGIPRVHPTPPESRGLHALELLAPDALPAPVSAGTHLGGRGAVPIR